MTVRHIVLVHFKPDADVPAIFAALTSLQQKIPGVVAISAGRDCSPEGLQRGNSYGFTVDFVDAAARDAYLPHPEHQKVGAMIVAAAVGGIDGVTVVDWEMA
jgi:hypothetical protein